MPYEAATGSECSNRKDRSAGLRFQQSPVQEKNDRKCSETKICVGGVSGETRWARSGHSGAAARECADFKDRPLGHEAVGERDECKVQTFDTQGHEAQKACRDGSAQDGKGRRTPERSH